MSKDVRCRKCKMTYSKKKSECPYCHKKRFKASRLIIFVVLIAVIGGASHWFFNSNFFFSKIHRVDGMSIKILDVYNEYDYITIKMEFHNKTNDTKNIDYNLQAYIDGYLSNDTDTIYETLLPKKRFNYTCRIYIGESKEWNDIEIYYGSYTDDYKLLTKFDKNDFK